MIYRIWHGWTHPENADSYQRLLHEEIVPGITARRIRGLQSIDILRRDHDGSEVEFVTMMRFDEWSAVKAFAGDRSETSVVPASARRLLSRYDTESQHYEFIARHSNE